LKREEIKPHRPLLVLYALGRWYCEKVRLISYCDVNRDLRALLNEFGRSEDDLNPDLPFCALRNQDGEFWELSAPPEAKEWKKGYFRHGVMLKHNVSGDFKEDIALLKPIIR
jgi:putative restriction endonuclease